MRGIVITQSVTEHNPILDRYLADIAKYDLLKPEEEVLLSEKVRDGDQAALHKLVNANLRFVVSVAKKYRNAGLSLEDLIAEGNKGLMKAARLFDASRGFKFISFAVWWIRQGIIQAIDEQRRVMRLPLNIIVGINNIRKAETELEQRLERLPTLEEVAEELGMTDVRVADHLWHSSFTASLDKGWIWRAVKRVVWWMCWRIKMLRWLIMDCCWSPEILNWIGCWQDCHKGMD